MIRSLAELGAPGDVLSLLYDALAGAVAFGCATGVGIVLLTAAARGGE